MHARHGFEPAKLRELHFDVLISLTARSNGAKVITSKRADFERIRKYPDLRLEVWQVARVLNFAKTETAEDRGLPPMNQKADSWMGHSTFVAGLECEERGWATRRFKQRNPDPERTGRVSQKSVDLHLSES
jgi:hypothetical protein